MTKNVKIGLVILAVILLLLYFKMSSTASKFKQEIQNSTGKFFDDLMKDTSSDFYAFIVEKAEKEGRTVDEQYRLDRDWLIRNVKVSEVWQKAQTADWYNENIFRNDYGLTNPILWEVWKIYANF